MPLEIDVLSTVIKIAFIIFKFLLEIWFKCSLEVVLKYLLVKSECMLDLSYILEMHSVRYLQALHTVSMSPFLEVFFECATAPVARAAAYLALELDAETVQLVQPVGYGLAVPAHGQILRVVFGPFVFIIRARRFPVSSPFLRFLHLVVRFQLSVVLRLFLPDKVLSVEEDVVQEVVFQFEKPSFKVSDIPESCYLYLAVLTFKLLLFLLILLCYCNSALLAHFIHSLDVRAPLLMMQKHVLISVGLVASDAVKRVRLLFERADTVNLLDGFFPPEETTLIPFRVEHVVGLLLDLAPNRQGLGLLKEVNQVIFQGSEISLVLGTSLQVGWDSLMLVKVLYPS